MIEGEALDRVASVTRPFPVVRTICSALFTERGLAAIKRVSARFPLSRNTLTVKVTPVGGLNIREGM